MFERYTERARRVIFFARYEASQFGSHAIETEHLLLGLIREDKNLTNRFLQAPSIKSLRAEIESRTTIREKVSTSIDLPLSNECKRILAYSAEEAERLNHRHIGTEHLLLGILREQNSVAAQLLTERGLRVEAVREELARKGAADFEQGPHFGRLFRATPGALTAGVVPDENTAKRIAEAVWAARYCSEAEDHVESTAVEMKAGVWIVSGAHKRQSTHSVVVAFIQKADGRVLRLHLETPE
jgi:hypothetical protein